jgi:NAD-dependent aldehyde dehydrogenases
MAVTQAIPITRHPYADGSYKKMLIDGKWVDAASGKKFETHNPATGELLATVAEGDAEDINRAVPPPAAPSKVRGARSSRSSGRACC